MKYLLLFLFVFAELPGKARNLTIPLEKYISKHFVVPAELRTDCNWNYLAVELTVNSQNRIEYKILNQVSTNLVKCLEFMENYIVQSDQITEFPDLIFITVQNETGNCGNKPIKTPLPGDVTAEILKIVTDEIAVYPKIKFLSSITTIIGMTHN